MKASRLLSILLLLQARGRLSAGALAQTMEVSQRTILRDIDQLSAAGVPVWSERGRQGGFQLREGWHTQLTGMTEAEAQALLLAGLPGPAAALGLGAAAASARRKMVASLPSGWREQADGVGERLHIDPVDWYRSDDSPRFLREVAAAVWQAQALRVDYEGWRGSSQRELEPLGLVLKAGAWYLLARTPGRADPRTYRLASLRTLTALDRRFKRPRGFDLAATWRASALRFEAQLRSLPAQLWLSPRGMTWLANTRQPYTPMSMPPPRGRPDWCAVAMALESVEAGARQLLGYGSEVEVIEPAALRAEVQRQAQALLAHHRHRPQPAGKAPIGTADRATADPEARAIGKP